MSNLVNKARLNYFVTKLWNDKIKPIKNDVSRLIDIKMSLESSDYIKLPTIFNNLVVQWGTELINLDDITYGNIYVNYSIPFNKKILINQATCGRNNIAGYADLSCACYAAELNRIFLTVKKIDNVPCSGWIEINWVVMGL